MSAVRIILRYMDEITNQDTLRLFSKKLTPPLVTLLNSEPEIQYVALRSINLIVQKRPKILEHEIKVFFCKYNDPIYVKMEKLEIVIRLASINNTDQVCTTVCTFFIRVCDCIFSLILLISPFSLSHAHTLSLSLSLCLSVCLPLSISLSSPLSLSHTHTSSLTLFLFIPLPQPTQLTSLLSTSFPFSLGAS